MLVYITEMTICIVCRDKQRVMQKNWNFELIFVSQTITMLASQELLILEKLHSTEINFFASPFSHKNCAWLAL